MPPIHFNFYENVSYPTSFLFTSENFDMTVSLKDRTLLVKYFYKNNYRSPIALQKFRTLKGMKEGVGLMTAQGLKKIIQKFGETSSLYVQSGRGRKRVNSTVVEEVVMAMLEESSGGLQP
ncbi:uncharacterized protein TNCV_3273011 [Trichonephila clavipes]|nr:uncharacterized protein TNCV_3273011 [Trichonephila clavipes]